MKNVFIVWAFAMTLNTRLLRTILLVIVIAAAMVTIPVTTIKQTAKAYTRGKVQVWLQSWLPRCAERVEFTTMDAIKWWG